MFRPLLISICLICSATSAKTPLYEDFKLLASDGAGGDDFGQSVAVSGETVVVGARGNDDNGYSTGSAYIYRFDGSNWIETKLLASDGKFADAFGQSVAVSGETVVVGAQGLQDNDSGSVYVYQFDGSNWIETKLTASDGASGDRFGYSVAVSGDTVVVGAPRDDDDDNGSESGSAYIYRFDGKNWIETKLLASDGASVDLFGHSVAVSGDTVVVGARGDDDNGGSSGSAYIYELVSSAWQETKLIASDGEQSDNFGWSVSISGDTVVVGAFGSSNSGSAYIYRFDGGNWIETEVAASDGVYDENFGISVATSGDTVVVGAPDVLQDDGTDSGSAYIYRFDGKNWIETKLLASDGALNDRFGYSVAVSGDTTVVGALLDDDNGNNSGSAYIFYVGEPIDSDGDGVPDDIDNCYLYNPDQADCNENGIGDICDVADSTSFDCDQNNVPDECQPDCDGDGWIDACDNDADIDGDGIPDNCEEDCNGNTLPDHWEIEMGWAEDCNGNNIPDSCDIADGTEEDCNGNNIPDSCDIADGTEEDCNENDVPDGCDFEETFQETKLLASDATSQDLFGSSVSISSDGTTALVGASENDDNGPNSGSAYIYSLVDGVWEETKLLASDAASDDLFGSSVSISGDGTTALVGAHGNTDNGSSGSAYIYQFDGSDWIETKLTSSDGAIRDNFSHNGDFGFCVSISSDGTTALVGSPHDNENGDYSGSAYIYSLVDGVWEETKLLASDGGFPERFGWSVAVSGDTIVVGALYDNDNGDYSGSAYIYQFDGSDWIETKIIASDGASDAYFGYSVATSGDTVVVGAYADDDNATNSGSAYIYRFDGSFWHETKLTRGDGASHDEFGTSVATNGDRVVVGVPRDDDNGNSSGSAYIYRLDGSFLYETNKLLANDGASDAYFGYSVATNGDIVVVGAYLDDDDGNNSGSAYIFDTLGLTNDCNSNGIPDECDLEDPANDQNNNGVLDECECVGDADLDGYVNVNDLLIIIGYWGNNTPQADLNFDGVVDVTDLLIVVGNWGECE